MNLGILLKEGLCSPSAESQKGEVSRELAELARRPSEISRPQVQ